MKRLWLTEVFKAGVCAGVRNRGYDCGSFQGWGGRKSQSWEKRHQRQGGKIESNTNVHAGTCPQDVFTTKEHVQLTLIKCSHY